MIINKIQLNHLVVLNKSSLFKNISFRILKIKARFTDQSSHPQEKEDRINITFVIK